MLKLLKDLYPLRLAPVSTGTDQCVLRLKQELPFEVHEFPSNAEYNGWVIPMKWEAKKATIHKDGRLIYDGMAHPIGVIGYSQSFRGKVSHEELRKHLFYQTHLPDALVYHCDLYYKVGKKDWGFSVTEKFYRTLPEGQYDIDLQTVHEPGTLKVCDYLLPGKSKETIILNAHNCHAGQANDDIAGVVVGVEVLKRLAKRSNRYSYRLIITPEHFGTVFYLSTASQDLIKSFKCGMFLEMLGNENRLALQMSFTGTSEIDQAAQHYLRFHHPDHVAGAFRSVVGNDETVWEAPGYEIPTLSLSRSPFPEYHTDKDNESIVKEARLEESVQAVLGIVDILETNVRLQRKFTGLIALSNPKYDLYISPGDPSIPVVVDELGKKWNRLMDYLPRYFDGKMTVLEIADKHGLPYHSVLDYVLKFQAKGLIECLP